MGYLLFIIVFSGYFQHAYSQNLLANGSFEEENICSEYIKNCAPEAWICTSLISDYYVNEPSYAYDGSHFIGLIVGSKGRNGVRTFARSRLLCGLRKRKQYKLEFYFRSRHQALDSVGIYFSQTDFLFETRPYKNMTPVLFIGDSINPAYTSLNQWSKQSILYTATGDEVFFTIGSFKRDEYRYNSLPDRQLNYYIYLDKINITPVDTNEKLCGDADSIRAILFEENERHKLLDRKRYVYSKHPPLVPVPNTTIIRRIDTLIIPDILFSSASAKLVEKSFAVLDSFSKVITSRNIDSIIFEGHTDSVGTLAYNQKLSADRASSVANYISQKLSLPPGKIISRYYAYLRPIAKNITPQGRQRNRRVEIYLYSHE